MNSLIEDPIKYLKTLSDDKIAEILKKASYEYYKGTPIMSDEIFDIVKDYLQKKNPKHPVLKEIGAPTYGEKVDLPYWMGSLDKIREKESSLDKWKAKYPGKCVVSEKLDGNSALLVVKDGRYKLYSRGDGNKGQDISHLLPLIQGIPKSLPDSIAVRGELIIKKVDWLSKGKGANARNAVAGVMHSKKPDPELSSITRFVAYEQVHPRIKMSDSLKALEEYKFKVVKSTIFNTSDLTMDSLSEYLVKRREKSLYDIDGIVIYHDGDHIAVKGKNPDYAFAFKSLLTHEEAEVVVKEVEWNASKDGYIKPTIIFDPVTIAGVSIQKATGFNASFIEKNVIGPGSRITIIRSGDVIPHVHKILSESGNKKPSFPNGVIKYEWNDTHVDIIVKDKALDSNVMVKRLVYFSKVLEMKGVGPGIIERLYANGVNTFKKFINVSVEELLKMEGFQRKSAEKVVNEIQESVKKADCLTFMTASNLFGRSIAEKKLKLILEVFPEIPNGYQPTESELSKVSGIGEITAKQFLEGLPLFFDFMKELNKECKKVEVVVPKGKSLEGLNVVFTGVRDKELEAEIETKGGKVLTSISSKTKVLIAKDPSDDSSKIKSAKELGIPVVTIDTFKKNYL